MNAALAVRQSILLGAASSNGALEPPEATDWRSVALTGAAAGIVVAAFLLAIKHAGKAASR